MTIKKTLVLNPRNLTETLIKKIYTIKFSSFIALKNNIYYTYEDYSNYINIIDTNQITNYK